MCLGDVFNRNKSDQPRQQPTTDATSGEQIEIDQSVDTGRQSSNRTSGGRKGASNPGSGASRQSRSNKSKSSSKTSSKTSGSGASKHGSKGRRSSPGRGRGR
tara:strand:+ start:536 stop:841 length:306 start_codon:yes stop_codon:yes gene_type:complete